MCSVWEDNEESIQSIHGPSGRACRKDVEKFQLPHSEKREIHQTLKEFSGSCSRFMALKTRSVLPYLIQTNAVRHEVSQWALFDETMVYDIQREVKEPHIMICILRLLPHDP